MKLSKKIFKIIMKKFSVKFGKLAFSLLALLPLIADKMNSLYAIYYFSSISSMGEIVERIGLSENFQRLVNKGNKIGTLTSSNIFVSV